MTHDIRVLDDDGIVEIVHTGRMTIVEATESRTEAAAIMFDRDLTLILADVSQTDHDENTGDLLEFNSSHYDVFPAGSRLAVVIPADPSKAESARFAETVAVNRGILMRIFLDREEALEWLRKGSGAG